MVSLKRHSQQPLAVKLSGMEQGRKRKSEHDEGTVVKRPMLVTASLVDPMLAESPRVGLISMKELETAGIARFPELSFVKSIYKQYTDISNRSPHLHLHFHRRRRPLALASKHSDVSQAHVKLTGSHVTLFTVFLRGYWQFDTLLTYILLIKAYH